MRFVRYAGIAGLISNSAFAASPHPTAQDADGDGFYVPTVDVNGDGKKDKADIGVKAIDHDDLHKTIYPGAIEIVADGIDQDGNGKDLVLPVSPAAWVLFIKNEYGGSAPSAGRFVYEHDQCLAATGKCVVDKVDGRFKVTDDNVKFMDIYMNGTRMLRNHGEKADGREVVTGEEISHFTGSLGGSGGSSGSGSGVSLADAKKAAEDAATKAAKAEEQKRLEYQAKLEVANDLRDGEINRLGREDTRIVGLVETEARVREEADTEQDADIEAAKEAADGAVATANSMASHGPLIEAGLVGGGILRTPLVETDENGEFTDDLVRGDAFGNVGFSLRAGIDADGYEVAGFGQVSFGGDGEGDGADRALLIGAEGLKQVGKGSAHVGGFVAYLHQEDHANVVDASVLDDGLLVGIVVNGDFDKESAVRASPFIRVGGGYSWYGTKGTAGGEEQIVPGSGGIGLLQVGMNFGVGALK